jgi:beta-glucosidase
MIASKTDFIGLNYYFNDHLKFEIGGKYFGFATVENPKREISDMGWGLSPAGIESVIKRLKKYDLPIYITENGLADSSDRQRKDFITRSLAAVHGSIDNGADVRGYFHWSLLDNFEWDKGFWPRFGLVEIDRRTLERRIRSSANEYAKICRYNALSL